MDMSFDFSLESYREPLQKHLFSKVRERGYDPEEIEVLINRSISMAIQDVLKGIRENPKIRYLFPPHPLIQSELEYNAFGYVLAVLSQSIKINELRDIIRIYGSILVVGAGLSARPGVPLVKDLKPALEICGAKDYLELAANESKSLKFKKIFKQVCDKKHVSISHKLIAEHFGQKISQIICFNWDNLIERAAELMNIIIPKVNMESDPLNEDCYLWKFHGDVELIALDNQIGHGGWVFPGENGQVLRCFHKYIEDKGLKDALFAMIIIGYSEKDGGKIDEIINLFEKTPPRPTYRIVVSLDDLDKPNYIVGPADFILQRIL
jgi:hypothetical protein